MKKIVLATGTQKLDNIFKDFLGETEWSYNKHFINERKYLTETIENEAPDIVIIHEKLKSHLEREIDRDYELLSLIKHIRIQYSEIRVVFLGNRKLNDRILQRIINLGVYDIFLNEFEGKEFKQRLMQNATFQNVLYILEEQEDDIKTYKQEPQNEEEVPSEDPTSSSYEKKDHNKNIIPILDDDLFDIAPPEVEKEIVLMDRVIGSIFISLLGIQKNAGTTHTALLIANYLKRLGVKVAIVEANPSNHFSHIEYAYEGGKGYASNSSRFEIEGVTYYKSGDQLYVHELVGQYDYILLDLGAYGTCKWLEEFYRSHVQIIIGSGSEWKQQELYQFHQSQQHDQTKWIYGIPFINSQVLSDIKKHLKHDSVYPLPVHADPYQIHKETDTLLHEMLTEYLPSTKPKIELPKFMFIGGVALITVLIFIIAFVIFAS